MIHEIESLASGECRWIGRQDVHVYCRAPLHCEPSYCVVCPEAGLKYGAWVDASRAAKLVEEILKVG
jgi:hypothetical protein